MRRLPHHADSRRPGPRRLRAVAGRAHRSGFTLVELLVSIGIILVLAAITLPAVSLIRNRVKAGQASAMVAALSAAINEYREWDMPRRRFPPAEADRLMRFARPGQTAKVLDLLETGGWDPNGTVADSGILRSGLGATMPDPAQPGARILVDPWQRPYRFQVDDDMDQPQPVRPTTRRADWNARDRKPFAYVWSLGIPRTGAARMLADDPDADGAGDAVPGWIIVTSTAATAPEP